MKLVENSTSLLLCVIYICNSAGLILFNKYLMNANRFPFAVPLVTMHMGFSFFVLGGLFLIRPMFFLSLSAPERLNQLKTTWKWLLLIAVLFSGQLVLTNTAYLKSSVAFLQMMKEGNVVIVYVMSLMCTLDTFTVRKALIICFVCSATTLTINGEIYFSRTGFFIQGFSQFLESSKLVLQSIVLSGAGRNLDPLSYNLVLSPIAATLLVTAIGYLSIMKPATLLALPQWSDWLLWWPFLAANAVTALTMNIVMAYLIQRTSALTLIFCGIVKDVTIVLAGHLIMRESLSSLQAAGFALQIFLVFTWSWVKAEERQTAGKDAQAKGEAAAASLAASLAERGAARARYGAADAKR